MKAQKRLFMRLLTVLCIMLLCGTKAMAQEAYAYIASSDTSKLWFYYDNLRSSRDNTGTTYDAQATSSSPGWSSQASAITSVEFNSSFANARPSSLRYWFSGMENLTSITGMGYLNTSQVTNMFGIFSGCESLTSLDLSNFDTQNVTNMNCMFEDCKSLTNLDVSNFDTHNVGYMDYMFKGCEKLPFLNLTSFNTSQVTTMRGMFHNDQNLAFIYVSDDWSTAAVTSSEGMFNSCSNLVGGAGTTYDSNYTDATRAHIDGGENDPGYLRNVNQILNQAYAMLSTDGQTFTFYYDATTHEGTRFRLNANKKIPEWYWNSQRSSITSVVFDPSFANARPTTTLYWFGGMSNLTNITGMDNLKTDEVTDMGDMFSGCKSLTSLDLSNFDTSKVTGMSWMFSGCESLTSLDLSNFNISKVTDMSRMFSGCKSLTSLDLSNFDTQDVTNMEYMFVGCESLTSLDLSNFDTQNVTNMYFMFMGCKNLTSLDLSNFDTQNVTDMGYMFFGCERLPFLNLTSFNTSKVTDMSNMFCGDKNLAFIYVSNDWNTAAVTSSYGMFQNCLNLVGGAGTIYSSNFMDATRAHIDGGTSNPGYLSAIAAYAVLSTDGRTLTFYYDSTSHDGTRYDLNEGGSFPDWYANRSTITSVVFNPSFAQAHPQSTAAWFFGMSNLTTITGMEYLKTNKVTNMFRMFSGCSRLTSLDLSSFNTSASSVMNFMFDGCSSLTSLDVSHFNTELVYGMNSMFENCSNLTLLNLSSFDTSALKQTGNMFKGCTNLSTIYVSDLWDVSGVTSSTYMFDGCTNLVGMNGTTYNSSHTNKEYARIDEGWTPGYLSRLLPQAYAELDIDNQTLIFYYDFDRESRQGDTYIIENSANFIPGWINYGNYITSVVFDPSFAQARPKSTAYWFVSFYNLSSITGLEYLNTSQVTTMSYMFNGCSGLTSLDLSSFDTGNVVDMSNMFCNCSGLTSLNLSSFNTASVTNMSNMFNSCSSLRLLDLTSFNTANVTNMGYMFSYSSNLTTIYVDEEGWSTTYAEGNMDDMFEDCTSLVGGNGTTYDSSHIDGAYAHIDVAGNPGYLSKKVGDVNNDGKVSLADVTALVDIYLGRDSTLPYRYNHQAADIDGNNIVNSNDVQALINIILR